MRTALPTTMLACVDVAPLTAMKAKAAKNWRRCMFPSLLAVFPSFHSPALLTPRGTLEYICDTTPVLCPTSHPNFGAKRARRSLSRYFHDRGLISKLLLGRPQKTILPHTASFI